MERLQDVRARHHVDSETPDPGLASLPVGLPRLFVGNPEFCIRSAGDDSFESAAANPGLIRNEMNFGRPIFRRASSLM